MRVGIDLYPLCRPLSGVGIYVKYLMRELVRQEEIEIVYPTMTSLRSWKERRQLRISEQVKSSRIQWPARCFPGAELAGRLLPMRWARFPIDFYHVTSTLCWFSPKDVPTVMTAHDLAWLRLPETVYPRPRHVDLGRYPKLLRQARIVVCVSESTRRDVAELAGVHEDRLLVTPLAARPDFVPPADDEVRMTARAKLAGGQPYLLALGTLEPRKNYLRVLEALAQCVQRGLPHKLIIVGGRGAQAVQIEEAIGRLRLSSAVELTGYRSDPEVLEYLWGADALVTCSLYEGFGLPVLEAMATGLPVVASTGGSLPEVAGDAALLVDPLDVEAIATAIERIAGDEPLRSRMRSAGLARAAKFSWTETARGTMAAYRRACA